jgi:outer membrane protein insertion porin family
MPRGSRTWNRVRSADGVKLGPRTHLWDISFAGARRLTERALSKSANLKLGEPVSALKLEDATRRLRDAYRAEGFAYADVRNTLEPSPDHSRARVHFDVSEGEQVLVRGIVLRGNRLTDEDVIRARFALKVGQPYRSGDARSTQESVALLNVFESVDVSLEDPYLPQKHKTVVVKVVERVSQYIDNRVGASSGDGVRAATEYGHRNLGGRAIGLSGRLQLAYLPDFLIYDPGVTKSFEEKNFSVADRLTGRITATITFPDIGLGPRFRASVDGIGAQDLQRGFRLRKAALIPSIGWKPIREVDISLSQSVEYNELVLLLTDAARTEFDAQLAGSSQLTRLLINGEGNSFAAAQKLQITWDRRDSTFSARRGTYLVSAVEHVDSFALPFGSARKSESDDKFDGHFFRLTLTFSGYVPLPRRIVLAATVRLGQNVQLIPARRSRTYPDRQFFLGGADSLRGFAQDSVYPQDRSTRYENTGKPPITGGDVLINPRFELRIPVWGDFGTVAFFDSGNVWVDPFSIRNAGDLFRLRTAVGTGLRWNTPVGVPLALDVGFSLLPRRYEKKEEGELLRYEVQFAMGLF